MKEFLKSGTRICYEAKKFRSETLAVIESANEIIHEYESENIVMSLRQLYYQMVARDLLPNTKGNYDSFGSLISDGRMAGLISWTAIEDRGRNLIGHTTFRGAEHAVKWLLDEKFRMDKWEGQRFRPEVWVEKAAQEGTVWAACDDLRVDCFACKGYNSQSEQWRAGRRFANYVRKGQVPIVFHLGDHDPSGIHMTEDNRRRLSLFAGVQIQVVRLALNIDQVEKYKPPPNPAKSQDPRYPAYYKKFGDESWELDALEPKAIKKLIEDAIASVRDEKLWADATALEVENRMTIESILEEMEPDAKE